MTMTNMPKTMPWVDELLSKLDALLDGNVSVQRGINDFNVSTSPSEAFRAALSPIDVEKSFTTVQFSVPGDPGQSSGVRFQGAMAHLSPGGEEIIFQHVASQAGINFRIIWEVVTSGASGAVTNYAQLDEQSRIYGISQLSGKVNQPDMIDIQAYDEALLGSFYQNGDFIPAAYFAQLDDSSVVQEIIARPANEQAPVAAFAAQTALIPLDTEDCSLIGAKYLNGEFIRKDPEADRLTALEAKLDGIYQMLENIAKR
jgi:hypothetical protein